MLATWIAGLLTAPLAADSICDALRLTPVTQESGIDFVHDRGDRGEKHYPETMGSGVAWFDADGDGWVDVYFVQSGPFPPEGSTGANNRLFRNLGDGTFEPFPSMGDGHGGYGQGVVAADVSGDGITDLYLTNFGSDTLLLGRGDGTFEDWTTATGLGLGGWSSSAALADADGDGWLDLYVTRYLVYEGEDQIFCGDTESGQRHYCDPALFRGERDRFYRHLGVRDEGGIAFTDRTQDAGFRDAAGKGLGVLFTDLDGDRDPDLYVANDLTLNLLFENQGDGTFADLSLLSGTALDGQGKPEAGMGVATGDVDGDGLPDLAVTNFDVETNTLYRNLDGLLFEDRAAVSGFGPPSFNLLGFGVVLQDFDRDGDLDAYVANGHVREVPRRDNVHYAQRDLLLLNDGRGNFQGQPCPWLEDAPGVGRGLAAADYDRDGDVDLAVQHSGGPARLLRNDISRQDSAVEATGFLGVTLRGQRPNTDAVGARVTVDSPARVTQVRWVTAGDSYQSSSEKRLLFAVPRGKGRADSHLEVRWPTGQTLKIRGLPKDRHLTVYEPAAKGQVSASRGSVDGSR